MLVLSLHFMVKSWKPRQQTETTTITTPLVLGSMPTKLHCAPLEPCFQDFFSENFLGLRPESSIFPCFCEVSSAAWDLDFALERTLNCFIHYSVKSSYYDNQVIFL